MDVPVIALLVAIVSLLSTLTFSLLNWRYAKRANARAAAAESRSAETEGRSLERSRVSWFASLCTDNYIVLSNDSTDTPVNVRVKYSIMIPASPGGEDYPALYIRSQDPRGSGKFVGVFTQIANKESIGPFTVVGLPIPADLPFSLSGAADDSARRFGLNLHIEWFTEKGTPQHEMLFEENMIVGYSGYEWPDVRTLSFGESLDMEAVTPIKTPDDLRREYEAGESANADTQ